MKIIYSDGRAVEAVLLTGDGETIRVAIQGPDDVTWFYSPERAARAGIFEADCGCPPEVLAWVLQSPAAEEAILEDPLSLFLEGANAWEKLVDALLSTAAN